MALLQWARPLGIHALMQYSLAPHWTGGLLLALTRGSTRTDDAGLLSPTINKPWQFSFVYFVLNHHVRSPVTCWGEHVERPKARWRGEDLRIHVEGKNAQCPSWASIWLWPPERPKKDQQCHPIELNSNYQPTESWAKKIKTFTVICYVPKTNWYTCSVCVCLYIHLSTFGVFHLLNHTLLFLTFDCKITPLAFTNHFSLLPALCCL